MKLDVTNSPFNTEQAEQINTLLSSLTPTQKVWLSGFISASIEQEPLQTSNNIQEKDGVAQSYSTESSTVAKRPITLLYGSETGNAQGLAELFHKRLIDLDFDVDLKAMDAFKPKNLKKVEDLLIITSTQGEGDPPDNAVELYEYIHGRKAPKLDGKRFSVLALGDETYEFFCQTGRDFDDKLSELGAERLYDRIDCDVDYEEDAEKWMANVVHALNEETSSTAQSEVLVSEGVESEQQQKYSKAHPYYAEVLENINLNGRGSNKETRHIELALDDFNDTYEVGDCLAILPQNDPKLVEALIERLPFDAETLIQINEAGDKLSLQESLSEYFEISKLTKSLINHAVTLFNNDDLTEKAQQEDWIKTYIEGRDLIDLIEDFPPKTIEADQLYQLLRKLPVREYSISSSYEFEPDEVHITVGAVRYESHGRERSGVCSVQLAERVEPGETIPIYIKHNPNFKFPKNNDTPVIMIGPGTGVAPYRAYLQEREALELKGNTWLFFGEQHFTTDFLYQTEWQNWYEDGYLEKFNIAFSRDTDEKVYVQHEMLKESQTLNEWIEQGAIIYVCGDEKHMAKDVHQTLITILQREQQLSEDEAEDYLRALKRDKRYQRDVY
ncbi:assimilatory sulfite reductase (NADPH) flavoprotein subunit [Staphylococcus canis]|uniref:Assimilatory sulfite reductase (NADPH) flavoprotein subunit n=1 Tax=Staphylococcus canis TaxID=2724942 RepID=A0ABS0T5V3_9STAP|nr:assimilatory sulfite reductase (NADPH) flavoprotein subunit [Staphylococcus canis]MBI5974124.1 assimilatory sulfite reductase (NADPH) flavoprotein subunit [Staphylococcus canis]